MADRVLVVQLGHCYRSRGATGTAGHPSGLTEQQFATETAHKVLNTINGMTDAYEDTWRMVSILADDPIDDYRGDAFVALHADGSVNESARGASVGYQASSGQALAVKWRNAYSDLGWTGFRPDNYTEALKDYYGVRRARSVGNDKAFIIEAGFLTNPTESEILSSPEGQQRVADALAKALFINTGVPDSDEPTTHEEHGMLTIVHPNGPARLKIGDRSYPIDSGEQRQSLKSQGVPELVMESVQQWNRYFNQGITNH